MPAKKTKLIGMPVYDDVEMIDVTGPYDMFRWAGIEVELVTEKPGLVRFRNGFCFEVTKSLRQARRWDAIWVPGGDVTALKRLMGDTVFLDFLRRQSARAKYVASVCEGAMLLAAAKLLDGYTATTHWAFLPCFPERFPKVKVADGHPRFVLDRNRLTGGGISSGLDEALKLIELLLGTAAAQGVQQSVQYYPQPPVTSDIPNTVACPLDVPTAASVPNPARN